jgi:hypothetical protein
VPDLRPPGLHLEDGVVGFAARSVLVVSFVGAGFAVGYVVAPGGEGTTVSSRTGASPRAAEVSISAPARLARVPVLARLKPNRRSTAVAGAPTTQSSSTTTSTAGRRSSHAATRQATTRNPRRFPTKPPDTQPDTGTTTDQFFHPPKTSTDGSESPSP